MSAFGFWVDDRQPFRYALERLTTGKVRVARHSETTVADGRMKCCERQDWLGARRAT
jgi:hypothetical protein